MGQNDKTKRLKVGFGQLRLPYNCVCFLQRDPPSRSMLGGNKSDAQTSSGQGDKAEPWGSRLLSASLLKVEKTNLVVSWNTH